MHSVDIKNNLQHQITVILLVLATSEFRSIRVFTSVVLSMQFTFVFKKRVFN